MYSGGGAGDGQGGADEIGIFPSRKAIAGDYKPVNVAFKVVAGVKRGQYKGDVFRINVAVTRKRTVVIFNDIEVVVGKRHFIPNERNPEKIQFRLRATNNQDFNIEQQGGRDAVNKFGLEKVRLYKNTEFSYTLQLKAGKAGR